MASCKVNVIYNDNGSGLSRDAMVVRGALRRAGHKVSMTPRAPRNFPWAINYAPELAKQAVRRTTQTLSKSWARHLRRWDLNIFLERLVPEYFDCARVNCLFPHQEWLTDEDRKRLRDIDMVLFKTSHAMDLLARDARASILVGFTSPDRRDPTIQATRDAALHVCGWNPHKGTAAVLEAWARQPGWPKLTVVTQLAAPAVPTPNVEQISTRIPDSRLRRLQNESPVHVCPSEVEGFGHTLVEALSCGAVVVTTDAPPMNEVVSREQGFLVRATTTIPMGAGFRYVVETEELREVIDSVWKSDRAVLNRLRAAARATYDRMTHAFESKLREVVAGI